jgi:type IV pilus assembly protein PilC
MATESGHVLSQLFEAPSSEDARRYFEEHGFCVLSVRKDWKSITLPYLSLGKKIKDNDFILFNQEFLALIKAGYPILKSIQILLKRVKNPFLKDILMKVERDVREGKSLSEAFSPYENVFSIVYTASLMAGEKSGNLASTLSRYNSYARLVAQTKKRIRSALTYPTMLVIFSFILLGILLNFVLPRFSTFYADFEAQLPRVTRMIMSLSLFIRNYIIYILGLIGGVLILYLVFRDKEKVKMAVDRLKIALPFAGLVWLESGVSLFARTLSLLLSGGISLVSSLGVAVKAVPNRYLRSKMGNLQEDIRNGECLTESLRRTGIFPPLALDMIRIGETSANLDGMLAEVAEVYDERLQQKIDTFVSLIEPVIIIFMGLIVAGMLLAVYLPIFNIIRVVR